MITNTTSFNYTMLNNRTLIDLYIQPNNDWHKRQSNYNISKLNFTWNCTYFKRKTMLVDLTFNNPTEISPNVEQDMIIIDLRKAVKQGYFQSIEGKDL